MHTKSGGVKRKKKRVKSDVQMIKEGRVLAKKKPRNDYTSSEKGFKGDGRWGGELMGKRAPFCELEPVDRESRNTEKSHFTSVW